MILQNKITKKTISEQPKFSSWCIAVYWHIIRGVGRGALPQCGHAPPPTFKVMRNNGYNDRITISQAIITCSL